MAGYIISSLDWNKFQRFINSPTQEQLLAFAQLVCEELHEEDSQFRKGDPVRDWPREAEELSALIQHRLALPDWYGDLSDVGKTVWESAVYHFCIDEKADDVGCECESDGVYWWVIATVWEHHGIPAHCVTESVVSHFGQRPYRLIPPLRLPGCLYSLLCLSVFHRYRWEPSHSMHTPDEVQELLAQLKAASPTIEVSGDEDIKRDYAELLSAVEKVAGDGRMLFIQVDT